MLNFGRNPQMKLAFAALFLLIASPSQINAPTAREINRWITEDMTALEDINCKKLNWMLDAGTGTPQGRKHFGHIIGAMARGFVDGAVLMVAIEENNYAIVDALDNFGLSPAGAKAHIVAYCHQEPTKTMKDGMLDLFLTVVKASK
jgi:hypothetical protein